MDEWVVQLSFPSTAAAPKKVLQQDDEVGYGPSAPPPSTPPLLPNASAFHAPSSPATPGTPVTPSAPSPVEGPGGSECVVCMEAGVIVVNLLKSKLVIQTR